MGLVQITPEYLDTVNTGFKAIFDESFEASEALAYYKKVATVIEAKSKTVNYGWLGDVPLMREWIGERVLNDLTLYDYEIKRKKFEVAIEIDREDIEYDDLGIIKPRIMGMASSISYHYDELVFGLFEKNGLCYDGKAFFDDEHLFGKDSSGVDIEYSNIGTAELSKGSLRSAITAMSKIKSDKGRTLYVRPNILVIPPELEETAIILLKSDLIDGSSNVYKDMLEYVISPHLTNPKGWYLLDTTKPIKPFVLQITQKPRFGAVDSENNEYVFKKDKFLYGFDTKDNTGYGMWQFAYYSDGSTVS